jgi:hypothetical protein
VILDEGVLKDHGLFLAARDDRLEIAESGLQDWNEVPIVAATRLKIASNAVF